MPPPEVKDLWEAEREEFVVPPPEVEAPPCCELSALTTTDASPTAAIDALVHDTNHADGSDEKSGDADGSHPKDAHDRDDPKDATVSEHFYPS